MKRVVEIGCCSRGPALRRVRFAQSAAAHADKANGKADAAAQDEEGFFSKHGGKVIGGIFVSLVGWFWRGSKGSDHNEEVKSAIMNRRAIAPLEIAEVRRSNKIAPRHVRRVRDALRDTQRFPSGMATPIEFEQCLAVELRHACSRGVINGCHLERLLL